MAVKAQLKIVLMANDVIVAESEDAALWQQILQRLHAPKAGPSAVEGTSPALSATSNMSSMQGESAEAAIAEFARTLGVSAEVIQGSCAPSTTTPFLHLNHHHWEALKKATPNRGPGGVPPATLAATLLVLWCRSAKLPAPTKNDINSVLSSIDLRDKNPERSLKNCEWLQLRNSQLLLNPTGVSKAIALAAAYCLKEAPKKNDEA